MLLKIEKYLDITSTAPYRDLMGFPKTGFMLVFFWRDDIYSLCFVEIPFACWRYTHREHISCFFFFFSAKMCKKSAKKKKLWRQISHLRWRHQFVTCIIMWTFHKGTSYWNVMILYLNFPTQAMYVLKIFSIFRSLVQVFRSRRQI